MVSSCEDKGSVSDGVIDRGSDHLSDGVSDRVSERVSDRVSGSRREDPSRERSVKDLDGIFRAALPENIIAFLPEREERDATCLRLIKHFVGLNNGVCKEACHEDNERNRDEQMWKKQRIGLDEVSTRVHVREKQVVVYLTPTKALLKQFKKFISTSSDLKIGTYSGECIKTTVVPVSSGDVEGGELAGVGSEVSVNIMSWDASMWREEVNEVDVMLISPDIMRRALQQNRLNVANLSLVIIDECHNAVGRSGMAAVCEFLTPRADPIEPCSASPLDITSKPRIFGMLSLPISCKKGSLSGKIKNLELTMQSRVVIVGSSDLCKFDPSAVQVDYNIVRYSPCPVYFPFMDSDKSDEFPAVDSCGGHNISDMNQTPSMTSDKRAKYFLLDSPSEILHHAYLRIVYASYLSEIETILLNFPHLRQEVNVHCGNDPCISPSDHHTSEDLLKTHINVLENILHTCQDSGTLCAMHAIISAFSDSNVEDEGTCSENKPIIESSSAAPLSRLKVLCGFLDDCLFLNPLADKEVCELRPSDNQGSINIKNAKCVVKSSIFDMFSSLVTMLGPAVCERSLKIIDIASQQWDFNHYGISNHSNDSNTCRELSDERSDSVTWHFYLREVVKCVANALKSHREGDFVLSLSPGSIGGIFACMSWSNEQMGINAMIKEIRFFVGCLLQGVTSLDMASSLLTSYSPVNGDSTDSAIKEFTHLLNGRQKKTSVKRHHRDESNCNNLDEKVETSPKRVRHESMNCEERSIDNHEFMLNVPVVHKRQEFKFIPLLTSKTAVFMLHLMKMFVSSTPHVDKQQTNMGIGKVFLSILVFVKHKSVAMALQALFLSLVDELSISDCGAITILSLSGDVNEDVKSLNDPIGKHSPENIVIFTTDSVAAPIGDRSVQYVMNYDPPMSDESFKQRRDYLTPSGTGMVFLYANTAAGDFQVKSLNNWTRLEAAAVQYKTRNDETLRLFLAAVSALTYEVDGGAPLKKEKSSDAISDVQTIRQTDCSEEILMKSRSVAVNHSDVVPPKKKDKDSNNANTMNTVVIKVVPDCLVPPDAIDTASTKVKVPSENIELNSTSYVYKPISVHLYALCSALCHPNAAHAAFVHSCPSCSCYLEAANSCGIAFLQPIPLELLAEPMSFGLRGSNMNVQMEYLGEKVLSESQLLAMQTFHRSILCWETDRCLDLSCHPSDASAIKFEHPMTVEEWTRSSCNAWYNFFPLMHRELDKSGEECQPNLFSRNTTIQKMLNLERQAVSSKTDNNWLLHLQKVAAEAKLLVDNLYEHQYRPDKLIECGNTHMASTTAQEMKFPLSYPHKREHLVGHLFSRDKEYVYCGVEDIQENGNMNRAVTFDDVMREGKKNACIGRIGEDEKEIADDVTYLQYYLSKGRLTEHEAITMRQNGCHELIRACGVVPRLSLFQILKNTQEDKFANVPHSHSSITHLLPSQCKILGRSRWFFCGLVLPSILWRIQGALLATEVSVLLSKKIIRSECRSQSLLRMMETHVHPQHSTVETSTLHFDSPLSTMALPSTNMMLTALTPRLALEMHDSERLEFLGDTVLKMVASWAVYLAQPLAQEGELTDARTRLISNSNLSKQAKGNDLVQYLRAASFSTGKQELLYAPPGMRYVFTSLSGGNIIKNFKGNGCYLRTLWNKNINKYVKRSTFDDDIRHQIELDAMIVAGEPLTTHVSPQSSMGPEAKSGNQGKSKKKSKREVITPPSCQYTTADVKAKVLADMVEAVVGAFYTSGGLELAIGLLKGLHIWPELSESVTENASTDCDASVAASCDHYSRDLCTHTVVENSNVMLTAEVIERVSTIFQYSFCNLLLLQEALSSVSSSSGDVSYQRLEFLGDGVLDLAIVDLLYNAFPTASQGRLTDLKCSLINNKALGHIGHSIGLNACIITSSRGTPSCPEDIADVNRNDMDIVNEEDNQHSDNIAVSHTEGLAENLSDVSELKILADVVEAVIGAIFMDSGGSLSTVQRVICHVNIVPPEMLSNSH